MFSSKDLYDTHIIPLSGVVIIMYFLSYKCFPCSNVCLVYIIFGNIDVIVQHIFSVTIDTL